MTGQINFTGIVFNPDFSFATKEDGGTIAFTRYEARTIGALAGRSGAILTRDPLLDAVSEPGSEKNDRNIDFLINRIRRKLGDSARDPKYIATRYGEGYIWLGKSAMVDHATTDAYIVVGPILGPEMLIGGEQTARRIADDIACHLTGRLGADQTVVVAPGYVLDPLGAGKQPIATVELTFFRIHTGTECVIAAKSTRTNQIRLARRLEIDATAAGEVIAEKTVANIASLVLASAWKAEASSAADRVPLQVAMYQTAHAKETDDLTWHQNDARLHSLRRDQPDNPELALMYAAHLHTRYVVLGHEIFHTGEDSCDADEAEIERLVLGSLDYAQTRPDLAIIAAKLLYFVDRGYSQLAQDITDKALRSSTAIASSLAMAGQLRGFLGGIDMAVDYLQQAARLTEVGTKSHLYVLFILCQMSMAGERSEELERARSHLYTLVGFRSAFFEPFFADPINPSLRAKAVALMLPRSKAVGLLKSTNYLSARLFVHEKHRENVLRTPVNLFVRRFGRDIVPDEVRATAPGLLS